MTKIDHLTLKQATPEDREFAYKVKKAAFRGYVEKAWGWDEAQQRRLHAERFTAQDVRIINFEGKNVGFLSLAITPECMQLKQIFILPEYQGRGIGSACTRILMDEARCHGLPARLRVLKVNPRARALYKRLGFVCAGETDTHTLLQWTP
jgi:ribosomal protein S18 acetylase RimI-like enzyme